MYLPDYAAPAAALVLLAALSLFASARAARPVDPLKPRLLPWRGLSLFTGIAAFLALGLLLAQLGLLQN